MGHKLGFPNSFFFLNKEIINMSKDVYRDLWLCHWTSRNNDIYIHHRSTIRSSCTSMYIHRWKVGWRSWMCVHSSKVLFSLLVCTQNNQSWWRRLKNVVIKIVGVLLVLLNAKLKLLSYLLVCSALYRHGVR